MVIDTLVLVDRLEGVEERHCAKRSVNMVRLQRSIYWTDRRRRQVSGFRRTGSSTASGEKSNMRTITILSSATLSSSVQLHEVNFARLL